MMSSGISIKGYAQMRLGRRGQLVYNKAGVGNKGRKLQKLMQREVTDSSRIEIITDTTEILITFHSLACCY